MARRLVMLSMWAVGGNAPLGGGCIIGTMRPPARGRPPVGQTVEVEVEVGVGVAAVSKAWGYAFVACVRLR
ncbi:hypothetical protein PAN31108_00042 [Pandoraea anhela]|uniref:Uncharacterized protein n=1 Tax=Pandoraea anhela TaxID=2508295 RepID=A0A5E4RCA2_9BURK|nr:hypothetical protein PAN31108_00042 [Pandoraea anhela]